MKAAVHYSTETDSFKAGSNAILAVSRDLGATPDLIFLFATVGYDHEQLVAGVKTLAEEIPLCGCTGAGIISNSGIGETTQSIVLVGISLGNVLCTPFMVQDLGANPEETGRNIGRVIARQNYLDAQSALVFLFTDGLTLNPDALFRGLQNVMPRHIDIVGGTTGTDNIRKERFLFYNDRVLQDSAVGILLLGNFNYHIGIANGANPIGTIKTVTKADKNTILEIDGQPALEVFTKDFDLESAGERTLQLNLFELGQEFAGQGYCDNILNRAIMGIDEARQGLLLAVEIPAGTKIRITRRDEGLIVKKTTEMTAELLRQQAHPENSLYFFFACAGCGSSLLGEPESLVNAVLTELGDYDRPLAGLVTFGGFAPIIGCNYFHNLTGVLVSIEG